MIKRFKKVFDWERKDTEDMAWIVSFGAMVLLGAWLS